MKENLKATTKRMIPILAQIVQRYLPGYKIEELAADEKIKAREFSYSAQVVACPYWGGRSRPRGRAH